MITQGQPPTLLRAWREARHIDVRTLARLLDLSVERYNLLEMRAVRANAVEESAIESLFFGEFPCIKILADHNEGSKLLARFDSAFRDFAQAMIASAIKKRVT